MNPEIRFSFDDAGASENTSDDIKLANLLKKYGIKNVIFYVMPWNKDLIRLLKQDFTIGSHTLTHPILRNISYEQAKHEIYGSKRILEKVINKKIKSFCYPKGKYNDSVLRLVKKAGYKEARTTDIGYIKKPKNLFRLYTSAHICPVRLEYKGTNWFVEAKKLFDKVMDGDGDYFHLWGHGWEIEQYNEWESLEEFLMYVSEKLNKLRMG